MPITPWPPRRVTVLGGGKSGLAAATTLQRLGSEVFLSDQGSNAELIAQLHSRGIAHEVGGHTSRALDTDLIVISPGIPLEHPFLAGCRVPVIGELELAYQLSQSPILAITGSNGKTTTSSMIANLLRKAGLQVGLGGNIGIPLVDLAQQSFDVLVAEVSSFQLETIVDFRPRVGVLVNIYDNHLDRHGSVAHYSYLKSRLFMNQRPDDVAVLNADDPRSMALSPPGRCVTFSRLKDVPQGAYLKGDDLAVTGPQGPEAVISRHELPLPGVHNLENALAALAAVRSWSPGIPVQVLRDGLATFEGVHHRLETARVLHGVRYVNDSKATNYAAAARALQSFDGGVIWIAGGRDKGGDFQELADAALAKARRILLVGESAASMAERLSHHPHVEVLEELSDAVAKARDLAQSGEVVLFSPACTSYDRFRNFEERGDAFKRLVAEL